MVYRVGREEGLLVGQSAGAACWAALELARSLDHGDIVTIFPDFGDKYLSTNLWLGWQERAPHAAAGARAVELPRRPSPVVPVG
jgi:hypothetical protein